MPKYRRFSDASVSEKILDTMFLITIGIGTLFAIAYVYFTHQGLDGKPGVSVDDIRIAYYGEHQKTRLGTAITGPMAGNLPSAEKRQEILDWIEQGRSKKAFEEKIAPILNTYCIMCHSEDAGLGLPPLTSYEEVLELTKMDTGASIQSLVRVSHIHMFGIAFILFFLGRIFILCEISVMVKRVTVAIPFICMLVDILSWYATKIWPAFAWAVYIGGFLTVFSIACQILFSLYQMWFYKPKVVQVEM